MTIMEEKEPEMGRAGPIFTGSGPCGQRGKDGIAYEGIVTKNLPRLKPEVILYNEPERKDCSSSLVALDIGFKSTGVAVFNMTGMSPKLTYVACVRPKGPPGKRHLLVADSDVAMVTEMVRGINSILKLHDVKGFLVELPSGGAQGARANRCMGIATGMIATLVETYGIPVEWLTQGETRKAGLGVGGAFLLDELKIVRGQKKMSDAAKKEIKKARTQTKKGIKERVMERMSLAYPLLREVKVKADLEHIADACATFEAAKGGNLVRMFHGR